MFNLRDQFHDLHIGWRSLHKKSEKINEIENYLENTQQQFEGLSKIFPPPNLVLNSFRFFEPSNCRVIIIGQDPYHGEGQAMGLSFSVPEGIQIPPSLRNIFKEMIIDINFGGRKTDYDSDTSSLSKLPLSGDLTYLAEQGVLLLNRSLTVRESKANSHRNIWQEFTKEIFHNLLVKCDGVVVMLWGNDAKEIMKDMSPEIVNKHLILTATHPSPLAANRGGWFGTRHFSKANTFLEKNGYDNIVWLKN
jgi:uracil-DNA glycosylase